MADKTNTKPGVKTTEFWLTAGGTALAFLVSSGILGVDDVTTVIDNVVGYVSLVLLPLGYTFSRTSVKTKGD